MEATGDEETTLGVMEGEVVKEEADDIVETVERVEVVTVGDDSGFVTLSIEAGAVGALKESSGGATFVTSGTLKVDKLLSAILLPLDDEDSGFEVALFLAKLLFAKLLIKESGFFTISVS